MADAPLGEQLKPCGPVVDPQAADRAHAALAAAGTDGGTRPFEAAWPALAPVFAASPYLFSLVRHDPERLNVTLEAVPAARLEAVLAAAANAGGMEVAAGAPALRRLKADLHLLTALADLGGVWDLDQVTSALTRFADAAVGAALRLAAREAIAQGKLAPPPRDAAAGPVPGLFVIAMGKHGGFELNYSATSTSRSSTSRPPCRPRPGSSPRPSRSS